MPRPSPLVNAAMDAQVAAEDLWRAAKRENKLVDLEDARAYREHIEAAIKVARRMAGRADFEERTGDPHLTLFCGRAA